MKYLSVAAITAVLSYVGVVNAGGVKEIKYK